jgi:multiple sugar transport system substrate-binding protein
MDRMQRKQWKIALVLSLLVVLLAACGSSNSNTGTSGTGASNSESQTTAPTASGDGDKPKPVEITVSWWGGEPRHKLYNEILDNFEKKYPHITVLREFNNDINQYYDKLTTQIAGNNAPDAIILQESRFPIFAERDALLPLDDLIATGALDLSKHDPNVVDSGKLNGVQYAVAQGNIAMGTIYNESMLARYGIDPIPLSWTWDDFKSMAQTFRTEAIADGQKELWLSEDFGGWAGTFHLWLRQQGKTFFTDEGQLGFDEADMKTWFSMWDDLRTGDLVPTPILMAEMGHYKTQEVSLMVAKKVAMYFTASNQLQIFQGFLGDDMMSLTRVPQLAGGQDSEFLVGAYFTIFSKSKHPEEAALLISYFGNDPEAIDLFMMQQGPLPNKEMQKRIEPQLTESDKKVVNFVEEASKYASLNVLPPVYQPDVHTLFKSNYEAVSFAKKNIDKAVSDFFLEADRLIK